MGRLGNISLKFMDIMIGVVLGLGFQWWPNLHDPWQYVAFIFVYIALVDYWIDYTQSLKKFPPRHELGILLDVATIFMMFLYIYSTQLTMLHFLTAYIAFKVIDVCGLWRTYREYDLRGRDRKFVRTWLSNSSIEIVYTAGLIALAIYYPFSAPVLLGIYIALRFITRVLMSLQYKEVYFS